MGAADTAAPAVEIQCAPGELPSGLTSPWTWQRATALVANHPVATLGELVQFAGNEHTDPARLQGARLALLPALHTAVRHGYLVAGPARLCQVSGARVSTWRTADTLAVPPHRPRGLKGLEDLVHRTVAELNAAA